MRRFALLIALALLASAGAARADDNDNGVYGYGHGLLYIGAGISNDKVDDVTHTGVDFGDIDKTSWTVFAGVRPLRVFGVEADYMDLGNHTRNIIGGTTSADAKAFAGYGVLFLPLPVSWLDLYGKAGVARWKLSGNSSSAGTLPPSSFFNFDDRGTEFAWGAGAQARLGNIGGRLEYERFNIPNTNGAQAISLSLVLSFL